MKQLIFDIETLGNASSAVCLCASFLVYDLKKDENEKLSDLEKRIKTFKLSVDDQVAHGRTKNQETVKWWLNQLENHPHLKQFVARRSVDLTMKQFYDELSIWLHEQGYKKNEHIAWQRGTIDIMIIDDIWDMLGYQSKNYPIYWRKVRELRTAIDLLGDTNLDGYIVGIKEKLPNILPGFTKHNPGHDILLEVHQLRKVGIFPNEENL